MGRCAYLLFQLWAILSGIIVVVVLHCIFREAELVANRCSFKLEGEGEAAEVDSSTSGTAPPFHSLRS